MQRTRLLLFCLFALGAFSVRTATSSVKKSNPESTSERDGAVMESVLCDLSRVTSAQVALPFALPDEAPRKIYFDLNPPPYPAQSDDLLRLLQQANSVMSDKDRVRAREAVSSLRQIMPVNHARHLLLHSDPNVVVIQSPEFMVSADTKQPDHPSAYPISAWPSAFSVDGRLSVVAIWFKEILHPALAIYVLRRDRYGWVVLARQVAQYL